MYSVCCCLFGLGKVLVGISNENYRSSIGVVGIESLRLFSGVGSKAGSEQFRA